LRAMLRSVARPAAAIAACLLLALPASAASPAQAAVPGCPTGPDSAPTPDLGSPYLAYLAPNIPVSTPTLEVDPNASANTRKRLQDAHAAGLSWVFVYI